MMMEAEIGGMRPQPRNTWGPQKPWWEPTAWRGWGGEGTSTCASICGILVSAICCRGEPKKQGVCWALEFGAGSSPPRSAPTVRRPTAGSPAEPP